MTQTNGPLSGMRIIDLTTVIMGPYGTRILADMGADVIKIEGPEGDSFRTYGPFVSAGMGGAILNLHRNKRSLGLDLKDPGGRMAFERLIAQADALVHNLRPAAAKRLGLDWDSIAEINPSLVLCAARGFASDGPYGNKAAYDDLMQAGSGFAALFDQQSGAPRYAPTSWCDKIAGQAIAYSVLGGLIHKVRTGTGQAIEVPMFEVAVDFMLVEHFGAMAFEPAKGPPGFKRQLSLGRKPYRTADGWACILPYSDRNWKDFFAFIGRPELGEEHRYADIGSRVAHIDELYGIVEAEARRFKTSDWMAFCDRCAIPAMPILAFEDIPENEHVVATRMFEIMEHPTEGRYKHLRSPVRFSKTPNTLSRFAPRAGEQTREILEELHLPPEEIDRLVAQARGMRNAPDSVSSPTEEAINPALEKPGS
ncbi:CaiB/BaiF CoA transferase family protein [Paraburkholderia sediminicola]|uniref:CaiB/BaiF CoA transferase family protein n=1 Tax=Paraburkholderia sediminicola TaxID=458836 RepID=UPI000FEE3C27